MPNAFAYLILAIWPLVCLWLLTRLPIGQAILWCFLGAFLLLPPVAQFDLPFVPNMDKFTLTNVSVTAIVLLVLKQRVDLLPRSLPVRILLLVYVLCVVPTVLTNADTAFYGEQPERGIIPGWVANLPGLGLRDLLATMAGQVIMVLPFLLGRQFLSTPDELRRMLVALVAAGAVYALPAMLETQISPQLNIWIYGFFQHDFEQMIRSDGFRPIVFMPHALWVAFLFMSSVVAAAALMRNSDAYSRPKFLLALLLLAVVLTQCKSLASMLYTLALVPVVLMLSPRLQVWIAVLVALLAVTYPMLRNLDLVPLDAILAQAEAINPARAESLSYRFFNEGQLLARADEKPVFGWGLYGRNLMLNPDTGAIATIPDGRWIIVFGTFGWVGYLAEMGLLSWPILLLAWRLRGQPASGFTPYIGAVSALLAITLVDLLINATLAPVTWLIAGAILGYAERLGTNRQGVAAGDADSGPDQRHVSTSDGPTVSDSRNTVFTPWKRYGKGPGFVFAPVRLGSHRLATLLHRNNTLPKIRVIAKSPGIGLLAPMSYLWRAVVGDRSEVEVVLQP